MEKKKNRPSKRILLRRLNAVTWKYDNLLLRTTHLMHDMAVHSECSPAQALQLYNRRKESVYMLNDTVHSQQLTIDERKRRVASLEANLAVANCQITENEKKIATLNGVVADLTDDRKVQAFIIAALMVLLAVACGYIYYLTH